MKASLEGVEEGGPELALADRASSGWEDGDRTVGSDALLAISQSGEIVCPMAGMRPPRRGLPTGRTSAWRLTSECISPSGVWPA